MPELPEVTTTVTGLQKALPRLRITAVWTDLAKETVSRKDFEDTIKSKKFFMGFTKKILGATILKVERRAKNILIHLSTGDTMLIHMKMTGHIMIGKYAYDKKENTWSVHKDERNNNLRDPYNRFIHFVCTLSDGRQLVLCDSRKFAKVTLFPTSNSAATLHLKNLGPEPLVKEFTIPLFTKALYKKQNGKIKSVLMDPSTIAGIGNIYSDEMLWLADIHPLSVVGSIPPAQIKKLHTAMKVVLNKGIDFGGDSTSDYRDVAGKKGNFHHAHNVYRRTGNTCGKRGCRGGILRKVIGGRSAHFCDTHQILFT